MKNLVLITLMVISTFSYAEQRRKPVPCYSLNEMLDNLKTNYGEKLDFVIENHMYNEVLTKIAMFRNPNTGSWTIIEYGESFGGEACILGSGKETNS